MFQLLTNDVLINFRVTMCPMYGEPVIANAEKVFNHEYCNTYQNLLDNVDRLGFATPNELKDRK